MLFDEINKYVEYYDNEESKIDKGLEAYLKLFFSGQSILLYNQLGLVSIDDNDEQYTDTGDILKIPCMVADIFSTKINRFHVITSEGEIIAEEASDGIGIILDDNLNIIKTILFLADYKCKTNSDFILDILDIDKKDRAILVYDNVTGKIVSNDIAGLDRYQVGDVRILEENGLQLYLGDTKYCARNLSYTYKIYIFNEVYTGRNY